MTTTPRFDEDVLRNEIIRVWGGYGAHIDVYDALLGRLKMLREELARQKDELERLRRSIVTIRRNP